MDHYASIKAYLEKLDHSLSDIEPRRRKAMVSDIEGHIQERLNMVEAEKDRGSISGDEIKRILDDFGPPEEVASNFKLQEHGRGTKAVHHVSKRGPIIAIVCISIIQYFTNFLPNIIDFRMQASLNHPLSIGPMNS